MKKCLEFLSSHVFPSVNQCRNCGGIMRLMQNKKSYRCSKKNCQMSQTVRKFTIFEGSKLECRKVIHLAYLWLAKLSISSAISIVKLLK